MSMQTQIMPSRRSLAIETVLVETTKVNRRPHFDLFGGDDLCNLFRRRHPRRHNNHHHHAKKRTNHHSTTSAANPMMKIQESPCASGEDDPLLDEFLSLSTEWVDFDKTNSFSMDVDSVVPFSPIYMTSKANKGAAPENITLGGSGRVLPETVAQAWLKMGNSSSSNNNQDDTVLAERSPLPRHLASSTSSSVQHYPHPRPSSLSLSTNTTTTNTTNSSVSRTAADGSPDRLMTSRTTRHPTKTTRSDSNPSAASKSFFQLRSSYWNCVGGNDTTIATPRNGTVSKPFVIAESSTSTTSTIPSHTTKTAVAPAITTRVTGGGTTKLLHPDNNSQQVVLQHRRQPRNSSSNNNNNNENCNRSSNHQKPQRGRSPFRSSKKESSSSSHRRTGRTSPSGGGHQPHNQKSRNKMSEAVNETWREAKDPTSGRAYFYNVKTKETQWRKPMGLCSDEEREEILAKERKQKEFFASMEANMLKTLSKGLPTPAASSSGSKKEEQQRPKATAGLARPGMVRTISTMDESLLRDLTRVPSTRKLGTTDGANKNSGGKMNQRQSFGIGELVADTNSSSSSKANPRQSLAIGDLSTVNESKREWGESSVLSMSTMGDFMKPEADDATPRVGTTSTTTKVNNDSSFSNLQESFNESMSFEEFDLNVNELRAMAELARATEEMKKSEGGPIQDSRLSHSVPDGLALAQAQDSMNFSESFNFEESQNNMDLGDSFMKLDMDEAEAEASPAAPQKQQTEPTPKPAPKIEPKSLGRPKMQKRNTCGTLYVSNTMSAPDKDATIKCVCGVFRAHILQSIKEEEANFMGPSLESEKYRIFNDFPDQRIPVALAEEDELTLEALQNEAHQDTQSTPSLDDVTKFYRDVFQRAQMETDCIIMSLIYVERLIKETIGRLRPNVKNWRSILMSCMVLSSKVWDDLSMWNADFTKICPAGMTFSLERINELELAVLSALKYSVKVKSSEYAKYYFLMRSMMIKSGMSGESLLSDAPLDVEGAKKLEQLSGSFQHQFKKTRRLPRKTKSLDSANKDKLKAVLDGGDGKNRVSLEHVVNMS